MVIITVHAGVEIHCGRRVSDRNLRIPTGNNCCDASAVDFFRTMVGKVRAIRDIMRRRGSWLTPVVGAGLTAPDPPIAVAGACLLFGAADALQLRFQTFGVAIPYQFLLMMPYLLTIAVLAGLAGKTVVPKTLGIPYDPESN